MGFSRREYWSGMPCLSPGDCPNPGIEPRSPALQADSLPSEPVGKARICLQSRRHRKHQFNPWVRTIPWRRAWQPTLVFLPKEFHVQRSLASYSPWGSKESDRAEHFTFFLLLSYRVSPERTHTEGGPGTDSLFLSLNIAVS